MKNRSNQKLWMLAPNDYPKILNNFQLLQNAIQGIANKNSYKTFLFTGSDRYVGVSTITFNLALLLCWDMPERRVLLIDANMTNPSLHHVFNRSLNPGLMEFLLRDVPIRQVIQHSIYPNLYTLPLGLKDDTVTSPFNISKFDRFIAEERSNYDIVLIDSSPLLHSAHTRTLSTKVEGVIVVAEAGRTRFEVISEITNQLKRDGANFAGTFLNKRRFIIPRWIYKYI